MKKKVRGFTLPEVLVTVTVVAVLAAVVVPAVTQYVNRGNAPSTESDMTQLVNGVMGYIADTRQAPGRISNLVTAPSGVSNWHGPYFSGAVTTGPTGATGAIQTAFTSNGLGVAFADSITDSTSTGYLYLFVSNSSTCVSLRQLDSALDGSVSPTTGRVTYAATCAIGDTVGKAAAPAGVRLVSTGK